MDSSGTEPGRPAESASGDLIDVLDQARRRFLALVADVRPDLHRYCARMTGSVASGEDVVQDVLARAYYGTRVFDSLLACVLLAMITGFATGMFDELYQAHVPGRVSSHLDFLADAAGVVLGQFVFALYSRKDR